MLTVALRYAEPKVCASLIHVFRNGMSYTSRGTNDTYSLISAFATFQMREKNLREDAPRVSYFCGHQFIDMASHGEPEQNEIAGPVVFALIAFAIVVLAIYLMV